jgi:hypothetical protein
MPPNTSLEWTSTSWPRYAQQFIIAPRGQLVPAPQLERYGFFLSRAKACPSAPQMKFLNPLPDGERDGAR